MSVKGQKVRGRCRKRKETEKQAEGPRTSLYLFIFTLPPTFFLARRGNRVQKRSSGQGCISEESPMLVAPLIMDGPQACSRWARQPQPQLRHFKKPLVGPLPSPSSHTGRSEAPENSETNPGEKGNLALPVLLTDGSTHLEQIVGSNGAALSQRTRFCGVKSGAQRPARHSGCKCERREKGWRGGGHRSLVQMICSA